MLPNIIKSGQPFSAHPRLDPRTGDLYNFGVFGVPKPKLHFYRMNAEGKLLANRSQYVGDYAMCHDFVLTARHAVFVLCPAFMRRPLQFLFGRTSIMGAIDFDPREKTKIIVLDLQTADIVREFEFDAFFGFHHGNGHEEGSVIHLEGGTAGRNDNVAHSWRVLPEPAPLSMEAEAELTFEEAGAYTVELEVREQRRVGVAILVESAVRPAEVLLLVGVARTGGDRPLVIDIIIN